MMLGQVAHAREGLLMTDRTTQYRPLGPGRAHDGHHDLYQRALACAVRSQKSKNLPGLHLHLNPAQSLYSALKCLGNISQINGQINHAISLLVPKHLRRNPFARLLAADGHLLEWQKIASSKINVRRMVNKIFDP
jgi:hypothetical protein